MNNETGAPERIWAQPPTTFDGLDVWTAYPCGEATEYTRKDLSDAMIVEAEQRGYAKAMDAERKDAEARIAELEAERDDLTERVDELQQACEVVSSEFEGELWQACRRLLQKTQFDFHGADVDGIQADAFESHMDDTLAEFDYAIARIAELEAEYSAFQSDVKEREVQFALKMGKLEAKLAKAVGGLQECEQEIDDYIRQEYPHDHPVQERYRQRDFAANPARTTFAELKRTD